MHRFVRCTWYYIGMEASGTRFMRRAQQTEFAVVKPIRPPSPPPPRSNPKRRLELKLDSSNGPSERRYFPCEPSACDRPKWRQFNLFISDTRELTSACIECAQIQRASFPIYKVHVIDWGFCQWKVNCILSTLKCIWGVIYFTQELNVCAFKWHPQVYFFQYNKIIS